MQLRKFRAEIGHCHADGKKELISKEEAIIGLIPDLAHPQIWGCKAYLIKLKSNLRTNFRDNVFVGYFIGYSENGAIGYKVYVLDLQEILVCIHVLFNKMIPSYTEEYFQQFIKRNSKQPIK